MPAVGKIKIKKTKTHIFLSDESGQSYTLPRIRDKSLLASIDPRIDLTKPIYEQVQRLDASDKAAELKAKRRKRPAKAA
jgi:hypothetical protein